MKIYFNINLEFDHQLLENKVQEIAESTAEKGYCCFIDLNSLVHSYNNSDFRKVLNNALINSCDGSYIAMVASKVHGGKLKQYIGPDFFKKFIFKEGRHMILGNTPNVYEKIMDRISLEEGNTENINYLGLPFKLVDEFDYVSISETINKMKPDYIWVSLGAPKQEYFMSKLLPYINRGVLLGVGAAFNYFSGEIKDIPDWTKKLHLVWVFRLFAEPKKQFKRLKSIFIIFPKMIKEETRRVKNTK
jgi:N-acetylglucosaminyldiphosphoundecaprenol N-acetyl-beta-D-mannosaminyltransferase